MGNRRWVIPETILNGGGTVEQLLNGIEVIEHSAYMELKAEAEKLAKVLSPIANNIYRPDYDAADALTNWRKYLEGE